MDIMYRVEGCRLIKGDCLEVMKELPDNFVDSIVTDPPYELGFMGKSWDKSGIAYNVEVWKEALRVLKFGGHLLAFGGSRTYHRMAVAIEDAGFEIRDQIMWIYGSGFPKSLDVSKAIDKLHGAERQVIGQSRAGSKERNGYKGDMAIMPFETATIDLDITASSTDEAKQWDGFGSALKPAHEPIVMARKPLEKGLTIAQNVLKYGTGAINIDGCRVGETGGRFNGRNVDSNIYGKYGTSKPKEDYNKGRFPANLIHDGSDEVEAEFAKFGKKTSNSGNAFNRNKVGVFTSSKIQQNSDGFYGDSGSASRFFYCAKASKSDRNEGVTGYKFDGAELILCYTCDKEIQVCKEKSLISAERFRHHQKDLVACQLKVICECGIEHKNDIGLNTFLSGNESMEKFLKVIKSTIRTESNLITTSQTWNLSAHSHTSANIAAVNLLKESGVNLVENAELCNILASTINELREFVRGANLVASKMQLKINVKENRSEHPTVKPHELMKYLCRLITPPNGIILDMFTGSGSTGKAAMVEGFQFIGIEISDEYIEIAKQRIEAEITASKKEK